MTPLLSEASRQNGHDLAARHHPAPSTLTARQVRGRLRRLDRSFADLLRRARSGSSGAMRSAASRFGVAWLVENDFVVSEALEALDGALPKRFLSALPGATSGEGGPPTLRIESIARALVQRSGGRVEVEEISAFLSGYQEVHPLCLAELWALPSFLRMALLEGLLVVADQEEVPVEVGAYILSLRALAAEDWRGVVESLSLVESVLREDPAGVYPAMDFRTRDRYRRDLERFARRAGVDEGSVARRAIEFAGLHPGKLPEGHVGYYIADEGRTELSRSLGVGSGRWTSSRDRRVRNGVLYFGSIALLSLLGVVLLGGLIDVGVWRPLFLLLSLSPAIGIAVTLTNRIAVLFTVPRPLPRLDLREAIPDRFRTLVAVPILLGSRDDIREILHTLESNAQGNPDPSLSFALVSDFTDAERERTDGDEALLAAAVEGIRELNQRYGVGGRGRFLLLHRKRRWNAAEGRWMGWERKRGKLSELNHLLLGRDSTLWVVEGDAERLKGNAFVLTLDADTRLPRGAAARLVGTLAHPLNRPEIGRDGEILRGFSILQPRIEILPDPDGGTLFSRVFGGVQGLDLYALAAFDVYQDLFGVGIFAGKGIYDIRAFEASLEGRTPENSLLSHDLFEGAHGRAGLVSDLILLEDFPGHPLAYTRRAHRWIRGDWQIFPWLFPRVPAERGGNLANRLSPLSRWMIADNLRRSLHSPSLLLLFVGGWFFAPQAFVEWTLALVGVLGLPFLIGSVDAGFRASREIPRRADLEAEGRALVRALGRWVLEIAFLPVEALNAGDAIGRALNRVYRTRRGLLEWTSAAATARTVKQSDSLAEMFRKMRVGPLVALGTGGAIAILHPFSTAPFLILLLWAASPFIAHLISRPRRPIRGPRGRFAREDARLLARRIWGYYQRYQGADGNWLAPDHFQEEPGGEIAYRTSPTNLGMAITSTVTAWDLGFLTTSRLVERARLSLEGMSGLERYRGHFLNWYDTRSRVPLYPLYVSTVDSGNLAAAFLVLQETLREVGTREFWIHDQVPGVADGLRVLEEILHESRDAEGLRDLHARVRSVREGLERTLETAWRSGLEAFVVRLEEIVERDIPGLESHLVSPEGKGNRQPPGGGEGVAIRGWFELFRGDATAQHAEILAFFPWLSSRLRGTEGSRDLHRRLTRDGTRVPSLRRMRTFLRRELRLAAAHEEGRSDPVLERAMAESLRRVQLLLDETELLGARLSSWYREMDFAFLYDRRRALFRIGFSVSTGELDTSHYDLLASESRIASFIAVSKGEVPPAHWLHLGRPFRLTGKGPVLLSWAGTMFEYLMPNLFLRLPPDTVLEEGSRRAVQLQREFGEKERIPWGISESGYHVLSREGHYQYHAFGVPMLGLRTELGTRTVVAPYASLMAIALAPGAVHSNLTRLRKLGGIGPWGPYEALDFGRRGEWRFEPHVVRSYMSHHHGMILAALGNFLTGNRIVERFHRDPRIASAEPYLYERIPWRRTVGKRWVDRSTLPASLGTAGPGIVRWSPSIFRSPPPVHLLASGDLVVAVGADGRGGSRWKEWAVVRGAIGSGVEPGGPDLSLLDRDTGESWSPLPDPTSASQDQAIIFEAYRADFFRKAKGLRTRMEVFLPPVAGVEVREISITNESDRNRRLRLAYAMEVALAPYLDDRRHPAFHKLFVRAQLLPGGEGIIFERRPRSRKEDPPVMLVSILVRRGRVDKIRWGTSRENFLGRSGSRHRPAALEDPSLIASPAFPHHPLDPAAGALLDFEMGGWEELRIACLVAVGPDRATVIRNASELRGTQRREWALIQSRARLEGELLRLGAHAEDPVIWEELLSHVLHPRPLEVGPPESVRPLDLRQSTLWKWGISGDVPYILVEGNIATPSPLLLELLRAQRWWRTRGEMVDIVVLDRGPEGYQDAVRDKLRELLGRLGDEEEIGRPGGLHFVRTPERDEEECRRLRALAALRFDPQGASLLDQLRSAPREGAAATVAPHPGEGARSRATAPPERSALAPRDLTSPSKFGGFDRGSGEYVIDLPPGETTPAPWVNIIARDRIGFLLTESGGSFTWLEDAGEFRMTPWHNDPVRGLRGEVLYLRDEETMKVWTPSSGPLGRHRDHRIRHGWGRTVVEASSEDLEEEVSWFLHPVADVKVVRVRLRNRGNLPRKLSATFFADWVMGTHPKTTAGRLDLHFESALRAILVRNPYLLVNNDRVGFLACDRRPDGVMLDRDAFLGAAGPLDTVPIALRSAEPVEAQEVHRDGCGVLQRLITLAPGEKAEVNFFLGGGSGVAEISETLRRLATFATEQTEGSDPVDEEAEGWERYLGRVRVRTPEERLDPLMNGWLPYQSIVSRLRGRTGFYQSGGAFGFRDQLQDVYALLPLDPKLAADHLVEAAKRQFLQGDVLHWWHPGTHRGVRTRCSDDLLWLPWVLAQAIRWTGDRSLLERRATYLNWPPLEEGEDEKYDLFPPSEEEGTLLEHAIRAIAHASSLISDRGLPLIGTGDWNDGMDRVGKEGRGESIWLGWFYIDTCRLFAPIAREAGRVEEARAMEETAARIGRAIEEVGWDGAWYRRAFFDDGSPLGSAESVEAKIDSIAQSWGVISGAADPERAKVALDSAWERLVRRDAGIALLLTPPFVGKGPDPGYIAAYSPGVRENGGQYTHATAWLLRAFALAGQGDRAGELLRLLLPTRHAEGEGADRYRVEPYVAVADIYGVDPHLGRGGWSWYTGSAGWLWRVILEDILGVRREAGTLRLAPCIPSDWEGYEVEIEVDGRVVEIRVRNPERLSRGVKSCTLDGEPVDATRIPLEGAKRLTIEVVLG